MKITLNPTIMHKQIYIIIILIVFLTLGCSLSGGKDQKQTKSITIFAAAGTRTVTEEICNLFEKENPCKVIRNYASSGTLARQIFRDAEADVFISANKQWIDYLVAKSIIDKNTVKEIARNALSVIAPIESEIKTITFSKNSNSIEDSNDLIAIGDPSFVPVGKYTKMVFDSLDWSTKLSDRLIMGKDVSSVLHYVELGECEWGVVYYTEALLSKKVKIIQQIPNHLHQPIIFYVAQVKSDHGKELSAIFSSKKGQDIFKQYGFKSNKD